jgi:hypothetical protein
VYSLPIGLNDIKIRDSISEQDASCHECGGLSVVCLILQAWSKSGSNLLPLSSFSSCYPLCPLCEMQVYLFVVPSPP